MKFTTRALALTACAAFQVCLLTACVSQSGTKDTQNDVSPAVSATGSAADLSLSDEANPRTPAALDLTGATALTLSGETAAVDGKGAEVKDGVITITDGGVYAVSGTLNEGRIIVNAPGEDVTLALNGASITCSYGSPLYVYKSASTTVHLMEGTKNTLTDGADYTFADSLSSAADEEPNACLYSKSDLILQGAGALAIQANYNNGLTGKDSLEIYDVALTVTAANHGVNGKDSCAIDSAILAITCGGDALRSTNDTDDTLGWVSVSNSTLRLDAGEDGIQAETWAALSSGSFAITAGGGSTASISSDASAKGIKAGSELTLASGVYTLDCADDAVHAGGNVTLSGGTYTISTGDDGVHADETLTVSGGTIQVLTSYEGLEGSDVNISGGDVSITSSDDGINAAGGADSSGFGGFGGGMAFGGGGDHSLTISGGTILVNAGGDGVDSNGSMTMSGGTLLVSSAGNADGALDYDGSFTFTGGLLFAASAGNMAQAPTAPEQVTLSVSSTLSAGTYLQFLSDGGAEYVFQVPVNAVNVVFSAPDLQEGDSVTVSTGGSYTGGTSQVLCSGGSYAGGTTLTTLTLSDALTTYGQIGMGGSRGGGIMGQEGQKGSFGGRGNWTDGQDGKQDVQKGDRFDAQQGEQPDGLPDDLPDGTVPDNLPDGTAPGDRSEDSFRSFDKNV
jgi:hypothetical protein